MKTVFLTNNSGPAKFLANRLHQKGLLDTIIIEEASAKTITKVLREVKSTSWKNFPKKFIDLWAIWVYSKLTNRYIKKHLLKSNNIKTFPKELISHRVKNASGLKCLSILNSLDPELVIVFGTSILKPEILSIAKKYTLNIHGGIVPKYRNVHSDFWALSKDDLKNIGTSIIHLDPGIDTGDIAIQDIVEINANDTIFSIKKKNIELSLKLITQAIEMAKLENLPKIPQSKLLDSFHKTPSFIDFFRLFTSNHIKLKHFS
ncbi:MAG: formyl transferase [Nitrospinota bacterium]|nr:formyl transferase [Nitrospinota bacterium]